MEYEDLIQDLVAAGAMAFPNRKAEYPDVGDDAVGMVANAYAAAEKKVRAAPATVHSMRVKRVWRKRGGRARELQRRGLQTMQSDV
jgi:hypothetical protein